MCVCVCVCERESQARVILRMSEQWRHLAVTQIHIHYSSLIIITSTHTQQCMFPNERIPSITNVLFVCVCVCVCMCVCVFAKS